RPVRLLPGDTWASTEPL
ncbi:unnamed protein product, partial [Rotaria magnacalcarata]